MDEITRKKLYQLLSVPFPESCIQRTEGRITGRGYDTTGIAYQFVVNRLNEVLGVGGFRVHREVTVKEVQRSNGRTRRSRDQSAPTSTSRNGLPN